MGQCREHQRDRPVLASRVVQHQGLRHPDDDHEDAVHRRGPRQCFPGRGRGRRLRHVRLLRPGRRGRPRKRPRSSASPAAPNPFRAATRMRYTLPVAGRVTLSVYDLEGRSIRNLVTGEQTAGPHSSVWDGRDQTGRPVASGPYFLRLSQNGGGSPRRWSGSSRSRPQIRREGPSGSLPFPFGTGRWSGTLGSAPTLLRSTASFLQHARRAGDGATPEVGKETLPWEARIRRSTCAASSRPG